jgi:nucleotide-binding universal stress UspA family protein
LIAISTHGRTGWERVLLGSTTERIIRHAPCPVLVVRDTRSSRKKAPKLETVLAPVDFSDCSLKGLNYAVGVAELFRAELVLLNTFQIHHDLPPVVIYSESRLVRWAREVAEVHMRDLVESTDFAGVKFKTEIRKGPAAQTIDRYAHKIGTDLIVTATHGWTGLPHVLMGSTAEQIVRYAKSPVLVVPTRKRIRAKILRASARARSS